MSPQTFARELLASLVVFLVALPLCMGIAIASGAPPAMGLVSGIIGGIIVGSIAGSPLQVSGPAAGLAVIVFEVIHDHGMVALPAVVLGAGVLQMVAGKLGIGVWFRAVAPAVIYAMLAGIGILIFGSQFHVMVDDTPQANGLTNLLTIPMAVWKGLIPADDTPHHVAARVGVVTLLTLVGWNWLRPRLPGLLKTIPAPLVAVIVATVFAQTGTLPISYVEVPTDLTEVFQLPTTESFAALLNPAVMVSMLAMAVIASAESLLCAAAVDKLHDGKKSDLDQELFAQGVGNATAGMIGGLPITGVIVRSTANIDAGATTRWSAILHGIWLLVMVAAFPWVLALVPRSALAAILVYIGYKLVNPQIVRDLARQGRGEVAIYAVTVLAIVATNLLEGLMVGLVLAVFKLAWTFSHLEIEVKDGEEGRKVVALHGSATFVRVPQLTAALDAVPADADVDVWLEDLTYVDHASMDVINTWADERHGNTRIAWDELHARNVSPKDRRAAA